MMAFLVWPACIYLVLPARGKPRAAYLVYRRLSLSRMKAEPVLEKRLFFPPDH